MKQELALIALAQVVAGLGGALAMALKEAGPGFSVELYFGGRKVEFDDTKSGEQIWQEAVAAAKQAHRDLGAS